MATMGVRDRWAVARAVCAAAVISAWASGCGAEAAQTGSSGGAEVDGGAGSDGLGGADTDAADADGGPGADAADDALADAAVDADAGSGGADAADDAGAGADGVADAVADGAIDTAADAGADAAPDSADSADSAADILTDDLGNPLYCGKVCAVDELCQGGACVANKPPCGGACASGLYCDEALGTCQPSVCKLPSDLGAAQKVSMLGIAESSDGCDHNGDGKPDNVFGKLLKVYPAANTQLQTSINDGLFVMLMDAAGWTYDGKPFAVRIWLAEIDSSNLGCSPTSPDSNCKYTVDDDNFAGGPTGTCQAQATLQPMTIYGVKGNLKGTGMLAGGGDLSKKMTIVLPIVGGLDFTMAGVRIEDAAVDAPSGWKQTTNGRICGVMTVQDFDKALASIPADAWGEIGLDEATIKSLVKAFLNPDIDLNKDGVPDAMSVALRFSTVPGQIVGVSY